jgi:hypothetical protein
MSINHITSLPLGIAIKRGMIKNFSGIQKFGYNPTVSTSFETIWDGANIYTYPTSPSTAVATSSNTSDDNNGTVEIQGLDSNYDLATETITIGGSASTTSFIRVFRAVLKTANTGNTNSGNITITVDSKSVAIITAGYGQTLMALYTIPRKYNGYIIQLDVGSAKDLENEMMLVTKDITNGNVFNVRTFTTTRGGFAEKNFKVPIHIGEKTDVEIRGKGSATTSISASFELILEKVDQS